VLLEVGGAEGGSIEELEADVPRAGHAVCGILQTKLVDAVQRHTDGAAVEEIVDARGLDRPTIDCAASESRSEKRTPRSRVQPVGRANRETDDRDEAIVRLTTCFAVSAAAAVLSLAKNCSSSRHRHIKKGTNGMTGTRPASA